MAINNPWLSSLQRSYNDIKQRIISRMRQNMPEVTDLSEGNIFVVIISVFSAIAEVLHYYIDNMARETFFSTARRYDSLYKHCKLVDYHIKCAVAASANVYLERSNGDAMPINMNIEGGQEMKSANGQVWVIEKTTTWQQGQFTHVIPIIQKQSYATKKLGQVEYANQVFYLGDLPANEKYREGSMAVTVNNQLWTLVDTFAYSTPNSEHFKVEVDASLKPYIIFGDGSYGKYPTLGAEITARWEITQGSLGNGLTTPDFPSLPSGVKDKSDSDVEIQIVHVDTSAGGSDYENFYMIKDHLPLMVRTLGMPITAQDYADFAMLVPGVDKAFVRYNCGKLIDLFITPDVTQNDENNQNTIMASQSLRGDVSRAINKVKTITTAVTVNPVINSFIVIEATITGKKSYQRADIEEQVKRALLDAYSYRNSDINKVVRLSDIYSLIDNQSMVDYLKLDYLWVYNDPEKSSEFMPPLNFDLIRVNPVKVVEGVNKTRDLGYGFQTNSLYKLTINFGRNTEDDTNYTILLSKVIRLEDPDSVAEILQDEDLLTYHFTIGKAGRIVYPPLQGTESDGHVSTDNLKDISVPENTDLCMDIMISNEDESVSPYSSYVVYIQKPNVDQVATGSDLMAIPILRAKDITLTINETI